MTRSKRCDRLGKRFRSFVLENFSPMWRLIERVPFIKSQTNAAIINIACNTAKFRPHPMSTIADYTSWTSLTDKTYLSRALPPAMLSDDLPDIGLVTSLFSLRPEGQRTCPKSTLLFPVFAQYLTDGFLRTDHHDKRKTTSNHDIDLSPLYGRTVAQTQTLRLRSEEQGRKGRLKSQMINGEEFPPSLYELDSDMINTDFIDDHGANLLDPPLGIRDEWETGERSRRYIFAVGGDRANSTAMVAMMNALFLREHNRLASEIERRNPDWDDERIFETARNVVIVLFIKIVVEEYINHISSACFRLRVEPKVAWLAPWNRPNWMTIEFSLLYRWHALIPERMRWGNGDVDSALMLLDNRRLVEAGLANAFKWVSATPAAKLGLHNTAIFLESGKTPGPTSKGLTVEWLAVKQNRDLRLQGYNAYRKAMGMKPVDDFDCVTGDTKVQAELKALYGHPDNIDFYVGLFAEESGPNTPLPPLIGAMVALDAFSQALNNPLLSEQVFHSGTFTEYGLHVVKNTNCLAEVLGRNIKSRSVQDINPTNICMTRPEWRRTFVAL
ncbi:peroxidase family protein [uncultured Jannaschia sp.]|uniref:peroxidase family protein n=1 Tax=uncultured Jannaschia sp. TaxID=293347 RepID=UPI00261DBACB|nr:peroxidase family protein [uncultured Jannaschia sp.]